MNVHDQYCERCDVYGHEQGTHQCMDYWNNHELPFRDRMFAMVGKVFKTADPGPYLYHNESEERYDAPPGTLVRLTHYTPETLRLKAGNYWSIQAGNYWSIQTLDGKYSATQIYQDDLEELSALDQMSLIKKDD